MADKYHTDSALQAEASKMVKKLPPREPKTAALMIRLRPSVKRLAEEAAAQERRSLANFLEWLIEKEAASRRREPP
jgi:predicted HicB family RNase H-like nuclease